MIQVFGSVTEFNDWRQAANGSIGVVPTMGNLHDGHLSLLEKSLNNNDLSVVTIFVNPKQFGPNEDFEKYPRTIQEDVDKIQSLAGDQEVVIFAPSSVEDIFPPNYSTTISVSGDLTEKLCGLSRPGHFEGVATVVHRLFAITKPKNAYFGQKDFQQYKVIERMVQDLSLDITLVMLPIFRDKNNLALSSRNQYLSEQEYKESLLLNQTIKKVRLAVESKESKNSKESWEGIINNSLSDERWEYLEVLDSKDLNPITEATMNVVIAGAFKLGKTRLIDNVLTNY